MAKNQVVILEAGTGTGKSTLAPYRLMNPPAGAKYRPTDIGPIVVTEPRILATTEIATFVGESMCFDHDPKECTAHIGPGYPVGYQCKGQKVWDESCQLIYVTDGTMLNWIANGDLRRFSTVVIDEAHERSDTIDAILTLLRANLHRYPALKVIIASATIDPKFFIDFFDGAAAGIDCLSVPATKTIGYGVPLFPDLAFGADQLASGQKIADVAYEGWSDKRSVNSEQRNLRAETERLIGLRPPILPSLENWHNKAAKAAAEQSFRIIQAVCKGDVPPGDIIGFLHGRRQCEDAKAELQKRVEQAGLPVAAYWLMKDTDDAEKKLATSECPEGQYKVVFASNLAETSLTIPGLRYVVDSGLINQQDWNPAIASPAIGPKMHSRAGVRQRWGRVGRKTYGWVFPLYTSQQFAEMAKDTPAGSTTVNLEPTLLKIASAGISDLSQLKFPANFVTKARDVKGEESAERFTAELERSRRSLTAAGALDAAGDVTSFGAELARSRLPPERTTALLFADRMACIPETALALIALDAGSLVGTGRILRHDFSWPAAWAVHARRCHEALAVGCEDDLDLVLRIYSEWESADDPDVWADQWWVDGEALEEVRAQCHELINTFAPGMGAEAARRPINLALAQRVRAVLSRTLTTLRFAQEPGGTWREAGSAADAPPVVLAKERLTEPQGEVVALSREFPRSSWGEPLGSHPVLHGLVKVLPWACSDQLDPFALMCEARGRLRLPNGELNHRNDPLRAVRAMYPVGATMRVRLEARAADIVLLADQEVINTGFTFEPPDEGAEPSSRDGRKRRSRVYQGVPSSDAETAGELGRNSAAVGGAELAPEEFHGLPQNMKELEVAVEPDALGSEKRPDAASRPAARTTRELPVLRVEAAQQSEILPIATELLVQVAGYSLDSMDRPGLVLELTASVEEVIDPAWHDDLDDGDVVEVVAGEVVRSHFTTFRLLHRCDNDGAPDGTGSFVYDGPMLDEWDTAGSASIHPGSRWKAEIECSDGPNGTRQRASVLNGLSAAFLEASGLQKILTRDSAFVQVEGEVVGTRASNRLRDEFFIVRLSVPGLNGFDPRIFVPMAAARSLPSADVSVGDRVQLRVGPKLAARRSGAWDPEDVERIISERPGYFRKDSQASNFKLATAAPLTWDGFNFLIGIAESNPTYYRNASKLWESSRRIGALPKPGLTLVADSATQAGAIEGDSVEARARKSSADDVSQRSNEQPAGGGSSGIKFPYQWVWTTADEATKAASERIALRTSETLPRPTGQRAAAPIASDKAAPSAPIPDVWNVGPRVVGPAGPPPGRPPSGHPWAGRGGEVTEAEKLPLPPLPGRPAPPTIHHSKPRQSAPPEARQPARLQPSDKSPSGQRPSPGLSSWFAGCGVSEGWRVPLSRENGDC